MGMGVFVSVVVWPTAIVLAIAGGRLGRGPLLADFKAISPVTLTPLSVIFGLTAAFLANQVWTNWDRAQALVTQEAAALDDALVFARSLPPELEGELRRTVRNHVDHMVSQEWPKMTRNVEAIPHQDHDLDAAIGDLLRFAPSTDGQRQAVAAVIRALETATTARRDRILTARIGHVDGVKWLALLVMTLGLQATIAMVHADRAIAKWIAMIVFTAAAGSALVAIAAFDGPFGGAFTAVKPTALQVIRPG